MPVSDAKIRFATVWLGGCSGCHMSFLDLGERLIELAERIELVYGPFTDAKEFPAGVDITLVEGAVTNTRDLELLPIIRANSRVVVSLGDCAVTGNVTSLRNLFPAGEVLAEAYHRGPGNAPDGPEAARTLPQLLPKACPLHQVLPVDGFIPGCPPAPERIWAAVTALLEGKEVDLAPAERTFG